jgi:uncharacterized glyoxalase superfamily protein PhnB
MQLHADDLTNSALQRCAGCDSVAVQAFGFVEIFSVPGSGLYVRHAQLRLGKGLIMLGSVRPDDGIQSPAVLGAATQMLAVCVDDPDAHFERARTAGAKILYPPTDTDFGSREYHAADLEGHLWTFGTYRPSADDCDDRK